MTKKEEEYKNKVWGILVKFRDSKKMTLKEVTDKIVAIPVPEKKGKVTINKKDKRRRY